MSAQNHLAFAFKCLHQKLGAPLILANVYDIQSAQAVAQLSCCEALATASYAVAAATGSNDDEMTMSANLEAVKDIARIAREYKKPLTVDFQDGYGEDLEEGVHRLLDYGVVGMNLEDTNRTTKTLYSVDEGVNRIQRVLQTAKERGVPDFVVNARCDVLMNGGTLEDTIDRGKMYLVAGATTVFVLGGFARGVSRHEVEQMTTHFGGKLNVSVKMSPDGLTVKDLTEIGLSRISIGPQLQFAIFSFIQQEAERILQRV